MLYPMSSFNPLIAWSQASAAAAQAAVELASTMTATTLQFWQTAARPLSPASEAVVARPETRFAPVTTRERGPSTSTGRSWYRAPYRSPFDPLFWMSPGHPADHLGDWIKPMIHLSTAGLGAGLGAGMSANPMLNAWQAPAAAPIGPPLTMMMPWMAFGEMLASAAKPVWSEVAEGASNVIDFGAAFSAYRSAGGHAVAQVTKVSSMTNEGPAPRAQMVDAANWLWFTPLGMLSWMQRR